MEIKEKIKKIHQKNNIIVDDDYIENAMKDKERVKGFMRLYKEEEIENMNYIFEKDKNNKYFSEFELQLASKLNLFNRKLVEKHKKIYERECKEVNV